MNINATIGGAVTGQVVTVAAPVAAPERTNIRGSIDKKISELGREFVQSSRMTSDIGKLGIGAVGSVSSGIASGAKLLGQGGIVAATSIGTTLPKIPGGELIKSASKYNTFYKLIVLVLFFTVFLKVIINIFRFFGIDIIDIYSYMGWVIFLSIILMFIPHNYSTLKLN